MVIYPVYRRQQAERPAWLDLTAPISSVALAGLLQSPTHPTAASAYAVTTLHVTLADDRDQLRVGDPISLNVQLTPRTDWDVVRWRITEIRHGARGVTLALTRTSLQAEQETAQPHAQLSVA
jgi:hypothetical protein